MEYNYNRREVYMPEKYHISKRHVQLTPKENITFNLIWSDKDKSVTYEEICKALYNDDNVTEYDKASIRRLICRMRKKGIKIKALSGWGYKLEGGERMNREDLKNYKYNQQWVESQMNKYEEMREKAYNLSQSLDGMPKAQNKPSYAIEELMDKFDEIIDIIKKNQERQLDIIKRLEMLEPLYRNILYYRYIEQKGLEEISTLVNYDYYNTCKFHGIALNKFDELERIANSDQDLPKNI